MNEAITTDGSAGMSPPHLTGIGGMLAALVGIVFVLWAHDTLLLLFAGVLGAIVLRSAGVGLARVTRLPTTVALGVVVIAITVLVVTVIGWRGAAIANQATQLAARLPETVRFLVRLHGSQPWAVWLGGRLQTFDPAAVGRVASGAGWVLSSVASAATALAVIVFTAVCFAAEPQTYVRGALALVPTANREYCTAALLDVGHTLRAWLLARLVSMFSVGLFVTIGLSWLSIPFASTLGLLAGLLAFIPNIGSIASSLPAIVLALSVDVKTALFVVGIYWCAHFIDDFFVLPIAERRIVHLPPVLTIGAQLLLVGPAGIVGIMLAAPLAATYITLVRRTREPQPALGLARLEEFAAPTEATAL